MQAPSRPSSPLPVPTLVLGAALAVAAAFVASGVPSDAMAQTSAADRTRSDFPDRRWTPVTAADGGLAGAGLATDPFSSAYANPALWLSATWSFRLSGAFVNPIKTSYRGLEIFECPPNGQGVMALQMLNILEGFELGALDPNGPERFHLEAEATRLARRDRDACLADPAHADVPVARLLDKGYAAQLRALIDPDRALPALPPPLEVAHADTVYLTVVDRERNVVSFINSLFEAFGSGLACPETGVVFHNRGKGFSLDPRHPNAIAPGKRPMHTIIPALARKDGLPVLGFGVMGGHYQPVGQAHVLTNLLDFGLDPQAAIDAPRAFAYGEELQVERGVPAATAAALARLGHHVVPSAKPLGGGQMIMVDHARGVLIGGSDPRKDGIALGY